MTQPDDLHPFRGEHLNFKPAVTSEWDLISVQLWQITALRCRVKNLEDALRTVDDHLMELGRDIAPDLHGEFEPLQKTIRRLLNPSTTIISDAEID